MMLIRISWIPYLLTVGLGWRLGHAVHLETVGSLLGIGGAVAYGWWRHRVHEDRWYARQAERSFLESELAELEERRRVADRTQR
jgi:hypothetical protein